MRLVAKRYLSYPDNFAGGHHIMTATRIIFDDHVELTVTGSLKQLQGDLYDAMGNGGWLLINPADGPRVSINPRQILYMQELTAAEARKTRAQRNGAGPKTPRAARQRQTV
jgi:hypothetical protein